MRAIDGDKVIKWAESREDRELIEFVDSMETVYDVNKILEQLQQSYKEIQKEIDKKEAKSLEFKDALREVEILRKVAKWYSNMIEIISGLK